MTYTATGLIATDVRKTITDDGLVLATFRLASTTRTFNAKTNEWDIGATNWFTVVAKGALAVHTHESLYKGDRIVVTGELKIRDWDNGERTGTSVELDATSIGHDLYFGTSKFTRTTASRQEHSCNCEGCGK
jgi:single-strand DNA-binding protein